MGRESGAVSRKSAAGAKMTVDILMMAVLPLLMAYSMVSESLHEWLGLGMFALFVAHHVLERAWFSRLFHGRYNGARLLVTIIQKHIPRRKLS